MVSILQRVLDVSQSYGFDDEEFFAHLALAKQIPQSNHLDLALLKGNRSCTPDETIAYIFESTTCSFEKCLPIVDKCKDNKHRARAYCELAVHFPDKRAECLEIALRNAGKSDKVYCQIALTFQDAGAAHKISCRHKRAVVLLEICKESLQSDPVKADSVFRQALFINESGGDICDLYRAIAIKANILKLNEGLFYAKSYVLALEKMDCKVQARHCKPLFKELVTHNQEAAVALVKALKMMPVVATQGSLIIAETAAFDVLTFTKMTAVAKQAFGALESGSFKNHAAIRLATLVNSDKFPKKIDRDFVTSARWIKALFFMGKKTKAVPFIKKFPGQVKAYIESITTATADQYSERRDMLLKAALKLIDCLPDIAFELVRIALPTLANDRFYIPHLEKVVAFAQKHPVIQERLLAQISTLLHKHRTLHLQRPGSVRFFIDLANTIEPLSRTLALQLLSQARAVKVNCSAESIASTLELYPVFKDVQLELYQEALRDDPQNITLMLNCARNSPQAKKEELLNNILDIAQSQEGAITPNQIQNIISLVL